MEGTTIRPALIACLVALICVRVRGADSDKIPTVVDSFVQALSAGDLAAFEAIADAPISGGAWRAIRDLAETSHSIHVDSFRSTIEKSDDRGATVRLDLDASRLTRGAIKERVAVPSSWILEIVCGSDACRVHSVTRRERVVARAIVVAPPDQRERVIAESGVEMPALLRELAEEAIFQHVPYENDPVEAKRRMFELVALIRELAARNGDLAGEAYCLRVLSIRVRMEAEDAIPVATEAVALARQSGDADAIAEMTHALGLARWAREDVPGALEDLRIASSTLDRLRDPRIGLKALAMRSYISINSGELRNGLELAQQLTGESVRYGWIEGEAAAAIYLGQVHFILRAPEAARIYLELSYQRAIAARDARNELYALTNLAECDYLGENYVAAIDGFRRAIARIGPETGREDEVAIRGGLAMAFLRAGRLAEADETMTTVLAKARPANPMALSSALTMIGEIRLTQGRPQAALDAANEAIAVWDSATLTAGKGTSSDAWGWSMQSVAGRALNRLGRTTEAESAFRRAIAMIEGQRSRTGMGDDAAEGYFIDKVDPCAELAEILVVRRRAEEALQVSEQMRARTLAAVLEQGKIDVTATMDPAEKERERQLNERLAELKSSPARESEERWGAKSARRGPARARSISR